MNGGELETCRSAGRSRLLGADGAGAAGVCGALGAPEHSGNNRRRAPSDQTTVNCPRAAGGEREVDRARTQDALERIAGEYLLARREEIKSMWELRVKVHRIPARG